jgi:peptide-methionine (S)-S-oxide reductase
MQGGLVVHVIPPLFLRHYNIIKLLETARNAFIFACYNRYNVWVNAAKEQRMAIEKATFGGGCFWCLEAVFEQTRGVIDVLSGYAGGELSDPTYAQVCSGQTHHAEVVQITFDPNVVTYEELLTVFWHIHDPTTLNRQGNDVGTQYRSVIFYHDETQKAQAQASIQAISPHFARPIVTQIQPLEIFYPAEEYHQDFFRKNPNHGYCVFVVSAKVEHFKEECQDFLRR